MNLKTPNPEPESSRRLSHTDGKLGGIQLHGIEGGMGTITRMTRARKDVLKVAIDAPGSKPHLYEINQKKSLSDNIRDFCERWNIDNADFYALQHFDSKQYITETTRHEVKDGAVLRLATAPKMVAQKLMASLKQSSDLERLAALKQLSQYAADPTFSNEFIHTHQGIKWIVEMIEKAQFQEETLAYALTAFLELMDHGLISWDVILTNNFIKTMADCINKTSNPDPIVLQRALGVMECIVVNSEHFYSVIQDSITIGNLISHLQRSTADIQQSTIALINSLVLKAPSDKRKIAGRRKISDTMAQKQFRSVILNNVIRTQNAIGSEMAHQIYVLQILTFNTLEERMLSRFDPLAQEERDKLFELRNIAFDSTQNSLPASKRPQGHGNFNSVDFKKLGFVNCTNPLMDFDETPPGLLCLDLMVYFARNQQDNYIRLVLENSSRFDKHECPFGKGSVCVTKLLCEILKVGEQPTEFGQDFYPMFFTHDHAFEECYCICIQLFNKTWKEMNAIKDDFDKVLSVVRDQILIALNSKPVSLDSFKQKLTGLSYSEIKKIRQQERVDKEQFDSQAKPVVELQREVKPEILDLVKKQRLNYLKHGTAFHKSSNKRREKSQWYCRLSQNTKVFHYGDIDDPATSSNIETLPEKLAVSDMKELVVGKQCPHIKNARAHKNTADLAFSIIFDGDEALNFNAPDKDSWCMWTDGINALLGKSMKSPKAKSDLEMLLTMEMKLRLLDLENIPIPDQPPKIPERPRNYNFALGQA